MGLGRQLARWVIAGDGDQRHNLALARIDYIVHQRDALPPPGGPLENLIHTVAANQEKRDDELVALATEGIYGDWDAPGVHRSAGRGLQTGLTWGDLRALAAHFEEQT